jgi:photosynthetic reaction center H subunit
MEGTGAITGYIDVAQIVLYVFWAFFFGLILYLRREDKREGYPLESDRSDAVTVQGFPAVPKPKQFKLSHGGTYSAPHAENDTRPVKAEPTGPWPGAPLEPTGDPMLDGVGPASWAERSPEPELTFHGVPRIVPMRIAPEFEIEPRDPDPRGMDVIGADGERAGKVTELWVDRGEPQIRYLEVEVAGGENPRPVLLPLALSGIQRGKSEVTVRSVHARHFKTAPRPARNDQVTQREEDQICAYFASGHLYATPEREEPLL